MDFNFYEVYKEYTTAELLKILNRTADYQPAAVNAAKKILSEREITSADTELVHNYFQELADKEKARTDKLNAYKDKAVDFFEPVLNPGTEVKPSKWLNILLLLIAIDYIRTFYLCIKVLVLFFRCKDCAFDFMMVPTLILVFYVPLVFYLLYKRKRWGWILLFADNLFSFIAGLGQVYFFFKYQEFHRGDSNSFFLPIIIRFGFVFFLWRTIIADFFGITRKTKNDTALVVTILAILFMGAVQLLYG
jgi:hypothetical protein